MKMLKIKHETMSGAMAEARRLLGDDVLVLHARHFKEPSQPGLLEKDLVEIIAAADDAAGSPPPSERPVATQLPAGADQLAELGRQIEEVRSTLSELMSGLVVTRRRERSRPVDHLIKNGVSESLAETVLSNCSDDPADALKAISQRIRCAGPLQCDSGPQRIALVGPTGVGKTTTAAKIAARYAIFEKKSVALLTLDTYRIGAVEQLAAYARILNVPFEVALCPEDGEALVRKHADKDLIVIDTVGRSQRNSRHISELGLFLRATRPTQVHLVLSASAERFAQREAIDSFGSLNADRVILTKLDECTQPGCALELAASDMALFSFVTNGQDVPDDFAVADSESLAKFIWEG